MADDNFKPGLILRSQADFGKLEVMLLKHSDWIVKINEIELAA
jgi:hypothetical protein